MIKVNLEKNIVEMGGNTLDHIDEAMIAVWEAVNEYPVLKDDVKKKLNRILDEKERPVLLSEKEFTKGMREILGATSELEECAPLDAEDIEYLFRKIKLAQMAGSAVIAMYDNYGLDVNIKKIGETGWDKVFHMDNDSKELRKTYNECITYLEKLVGEEDDN